MLAHISLIEDWDEDSEEVTAFLFWSDTGGLPIGLRLRPCSTSADPFRPHYDVAPGRVVALSRDEQGRLLKGDELVHLSWQEIYITHRPPPESVVHEHANKLYIPMNLGSTVPFRISNDHVDALPLSPWPIELTGCSPMPLPWDGSFPVTLQFDLRDVGVQFQTFYGMLTLGRCGASGMHWAALRFTWRSLAEITREDWFEGKHDCDCDHIDTWEGRSKAFRFDEWPLTTGRFTMTSHGTVDGTVSEFEPSVILTFNPCPINRETTLIMYITTE